ncbi:protein-tyrosine-phosphatase [Agaricicola taiwanensis]|uniref:Protein-tyrosine-phosphatase n=2 Tax=Agaricicola taiwanensis TaxID=591372 RepID=A0A8J3DXH7_9RHOB|nr:protein-tyrosine-phosphatase [Agaricicola taiwanensis]
MHSPLTRILGAAEHLFIDHALFRYIYLNLHRVSPNMERAAQPSPLHIRAAARRGVKTVINLRGERNCASYLMEKKACEENGIKLINFGITSRAAPAPEQILAFDQLLSEIEYPALMHCKSGADRAGIASALYLLLRENSSFAEAFAQLSLRYGHIRQAKTGILDATLMAYAADAARTNVDFKTWVQDHYDPAEVTRSFHSSRLANIFNDRILDRE